MARIIIGVETDEVGIQDSQQDLAPDREDSVVLISMNIST